MIALGKALCLVACFVGAQGFLPAQPFIARKGWNDAASALPLRKAISCRLPSASRQRFTATRMAVEEESLQRLVDSKGRRYIIVGGKGGVGKTSTSAALAVKLADEGLRTLVISTDPAHSLGDALMTDLSKGKVTPVAEQGGNLYALEVDLKEAIEEFKAVIKSLKGSEDVDSIASKLGLSEMTDIFDVPPPGADELVALSKIISLVEEGEAKTALGQAIEFDRIVIDTAPTGHTLRLLEYPRFISDLITKGLSLRDKIDVPFDLVNKAGSFFASQLGFKMPSKDGVESGVKRLNEKAAKLRDRMRMFDELLHDESRAEFVVVCIATHLSSAETSRLVPTLMKSGVSVRHIIVNQLLQSNAETEIFLSRRKKEQHAILEKIRQSPHTGPLQITEVPLFDTEIVGVYGLRALANVAFSPNKVSLDRYGKLFDPSARGQFVFVGGKGGVGKTSTSSALAVQLADLNMKTLIVSTDPAHSLGDCLDVKLSGQPTPVEGTNGLLYAMEIDTEQAVEDFKEKLRGITSFSSRFGELANQLGLDEFADIIETPPPGIDEIVSLAKVLQVVKSSNFDRVIVDTAPTGHTLRLLSFPEFLDSFLQKVLALKRRLDGAINTAKSLFGLKSFVSGDESRDDIEDAARAIERYREEAEELRKLLTDKDRTQFVGVSIASALSFAESERLVQGLKERGVAIDNLVVNQLLGDASDPAAVARIVKAQAKCIKELEDLSASAPLEQPDAHPIWLNQVPFFDSELRSVYALRALSNALFSSKISV